MSIRIKNSWNCNVWFIALPVVCITISIGVSFWLIREICENPNILHAQFSPAHVHYNEILHVSCDEGYIISDPVELKCEFSDGIYQYSQPWPICTESVCNVAHCTVCSSNPDVCIACQNGLPLVSGKCIIGYLGKVWYRWKTYSKSREC